MEDDFPLVSVAVITYNSARFVIDTLESARLQSYKNIELIIADDCSTDDTLALCEDWLLINKGYFVRTVIVAAKKNTGIPANCNRAVKATKGAWVKLIAGDDVLHEHCIAINIDFCRTRRFSDMIVISNTIEFVDGSDHKAGKLQVPTDVDVWNKGANPAIQHAYFLIKYTGNSASLFISKNILIDVPFDEGIPFLEDWPFAINATKRGYTFHYLNKVTVYYRISNNSVFASKSPEVLFNDFYKKQRPFMFQYIYPNVSRLERIVTDIEFNRMKMIDDLGLNRNNVLCRLINAVSYRLTPYYIFKKFRKNIRNLR